jgi:peptidyl-prolyl cis-trans isomerase C
MIDEREIDFQIVAGGDGGEDALFRALLKRRLDREAQAAGIVADADEAVARLEALTDDPAAAELAGRGIDAAFLAEQVAVDLRIEAWLERFAPSEEEAVAFYESRLADTVRPGRVRLRQILLTIDEDRPESRRAPVTALMETIRRDPAPFAQRAARYSQCPSALNGGDLGVVEPERLYPEIAAAVAAMRPGDSAVVVATELGLHLIEVTERIEPARLTREEGIAAASALLARRRRERLLGDLAADVRDALGGKGRRP